MLISITIRTIHFDLIFIVKQHVHGIRGRPTKQYNIFKSLYSYKTDKGDLFIFEKVSTYCSRLRVGFMVFNGTYAYFYHNSNYSF
jgi:hypothetical protein